VFCENVIHEESKLKRKRKCFLLLPVTGCPMLRENEWFLLTVMCSTVKHFHKHLLKSHIQLFCYALLDKLCFIGWTTILYKLLTYNYLLTVRDATARLPNGEGTRTDICELLKDSQYLAPVSQESYLHSVVSGALDRLHYETDPCVKYDTKRKIWIYLHRGRTEEEFGKKPSLNWNFHRVYAEVPSE
jgi:hypothetical protein